MSAQAEPNRRRAKNASMLLPDIHAPRRVLPREDSMALVSDDGTLRTALDPSGRFAWVTDG